MTGERISLIEDRLLNDTVPALVPSLSRNVSRAIEQTIENHVVANCPGGNGVERQIDNAFQASRGTIAAAGSLIRHKATWVVLIGAYYKHVIGRCDQLRQDIRIDLVGDPNCTGRCAIGAPEFGPGCRIGKEVSAASQVSRSDDDCQGAEVGAA